MKKIAEAEIESIDKRIEAEQTRYESRTGYLKSLLYQYFQAVPHMKTKTKESYKLLSGTLALKKGTTEYTHDDEALIAWLEKNHYTDYVKTVKKPAWGEFKKSIVANGDKALVADTGEVIPCITVSTKPDKFTVEL